MADDENASFEFDVALSFAGEDRDYVAQIAERLRNQDVRVFYDTYEQATLWGKNLYDHLDRVYRRDARYCVLFISKHYAKKVWTNHERQSAQARALEENREYVLPVRFDDTEIPGLRSTIGYIDAQHTPPDNLTELILQKLGGPSSRDVARRRTRVPRTPEQLSLLRTEKPPAWEYLLFAGVLLQGKNALEPKWHDHQLRYVRMMGPTLNDSQVGSFIDGVMEEPLVFAQNVERVLRPDMMEWAFGALGVPGNALRIEHLGQRLVAVYEDFLDWSSKLRGAVTPPMYRHLFDIAASTADVPIRQFREFIDHYVASMDRLSELIGKPTDEPSEMAFTLKLDIDHRRIDEYNRELKRLKRRRAFR
jgi:hypothetical protein